MDFNEFETQSIELVGKTSSRGRHCFRCAINHLKRGWELRGTDPEMAAFRAITAEEEAASGLMYILKERGYKDADLLNPQNHKHKSAIIPFFSVIAMFFHDTISTQEIKPFLHHREAEDGRPQHLAIGLPVTIDGKELHAYPIPPLNFITTVDGLLPSYRYQIDKLVTEKNKKSIEYYIREEANLRNRLLYATPDGYPAVTELPDSFFIEKKRRVFLMMNAFLFIQPYNEIQPFVQNSLSAFLTMLGIRNGDGFHPTV